MAALVGVALVVLFFLLVCALVIGACAAWNNDFERGADNGDDRS